jgi:hypothetical protein
MFAELVCLEMTPAKWHGGASIFRELAQRWANQDLVRKLPPFDARGQDASPSWPGLRGFDGDPSSPTKLVTGHTGKVNRNALREQLLRES